MEELLLRVLGLSDAEVDAARLTAVLLLVLARVTPLAWLAPWLGWKGTAAFARLAVAVVLALALTPLALSTAPALPEDALALTLLAIREALLGATFAIAASVPLYALGWTGSLIDRWRGGSTQTSELGPLGALHLAAGVVLFVSLGGHRLALAAFAETFVHVPTGAGAPATALAAFALGAGRVVTDALSLALAFAAPAAVAFVVLELVVGLFGRVAPALRLWMELMGLRAALGVALALLGLVALLPSLGPVFAESVDIASDLVERSAPW